MYRVVYVLIAVVGALVSGCTESAEDQVLAQYKRGEEAIAAMDAANWRMTMSTDSIAWLQEVLRLTLDGSLAESRALAPSRMELVLALRNRLDPPDIRSMTFDDLLVWMIDEEFVSVDADWGIAPHSVSIQGDRAIIQMGEEIEEQSSRTPRMRMGRRGRGAVGSLISLAANRSKKSVEPIEGFTLEYVSIDGFWYMDYTAHMDQYDDEIRESAKEARVALDKFVSEREREESGKLKPTIWLPVGR